TMEEMNSVLVTGYSKAPQGTSMYEIYKHAGIVLEVNLETDVIIDVECTFVAKLTNEFFKRLLVGFDLKDDFQNIVQRIKKYYYTPSQQATIVALQVATQRYWDHKGK